MIIESYLSKIAIAVIKKAATKTILYPAVKGFEIYSTATGAIDIYHQLESVNDSHELMVKGLKVASDRLPDYAISKLVDIGAHTFSVEQTKSGLYVASKIVPTFKIADSTSQIFQGQNLTLETGDRLSFVNRLSLFNDESTLESISRNDSDPNIRIAAINKLTVSSSEYELEHIARQDSNPNVRIAAINKLTVGSSEYELEHISRQDDNPNVRIAAINKLTVGSSEYELEHIARQDNNPNVRIAAINKLTIGSSEYELEHIARQDNNPNVRIAAINKLTLGSSKYELEHIAKYDSDPNVRNVAEAKLKK